MGVVGQRHASTALTSGKTRYPLYRRLGGPQGRSGQVRKISPPPGFDLRTAKPLASRCTDYAISALIVSLNSFKTSRIFMAHFFRIYSKFRFSLTVKCPKWYTKRFADIFFLLLLRVLSHITTNTEVFYYTRMCNNIARTRKLA
jgi:hypothetical protein